MPLPSVAAGHERIGKVNGKFVGRWWNAGATSGDEVTMTKHLKETERLAKIVEAFPKATVTVLGDMVADEFVFGEISRVSREAPVLILKHRERTIMPGGA